MKAAASGDPLILEETQLRNDVRRLELLQASHADETAAMARSARNEDRFANEWGPKDRAQLEAVKQESDKHPVVEGQFTPLNVAGTKYSKREDAIKALQSAMKRVLATEGDGRSEKVIYRGVEFAITGNAKYFEFETPTGTLESVRPSQDTQPSMAGFITRINNYLNRIPTWIEDVNAKIAEAKQRAIELRNMSMQGFAQAGDLEKAREVHKRVQRRLIAKGPDIPVTQRAQLNRALDLQRKALRDAGMGEALDEFIGSKDADASHNGEVGLGEDSNYSRTTATQAAYEARIDALFAEAPASRDGVRVLDRSDVMGLLKYPDVPLVLNEPHILNDGRTNHPKMTAKVWKQIPEWIENPAAVYTDPNHPGRLTIVAPERLAGHPVLIAVEPSTERRKSNPDHLLVTAFAKTTGDLPAYGYLASSGRLLYADTKAAPEVRRRIGDNPQPNRPASGAKRILTESNLAGYRKAQQLRHSFAGQNAQTADKHALTTAQERIASGEDAEAVRQDTGWHEGVDGKWRFEIDDLQARLQNMRMENGEGRRATSLSEILDHPALFAAYPELAVLDVQIDIEPGAGEHGSFSPGTPGDADYFGTSPEIKVIAANEVQALSILLHEIQHAIQTNEGFASGGSQSQFASGPMFNPRARDLAADLSENLTGGVTARPAEIERALSYGNTAELTEIAARHGFASVDEAMAFLRREDAKRTPFGQYRRLAGEIESRNVETRRNLSAAERRATAPAATQDMANADAIVMWNGTEMNSAPANALTTPQQQARTALNAQIREIVARIGQSLNLPVRTFGTVADARQHFGNDGIPADVRGIEQAGRDIALVLENLHSAEEAEFVLFHELLHAGLSRMNPRTSREYASLMNRLVMRNAKLKEDAAKWKNKYGAGDRQALMKRGFTAAQADARIDMLAIEEALADLSGRNVQISGWKGFVAEVQKLLRGLGLENLANWLEGRTDAEALQVVSSARATVTQQGDVRMVGQADGDLQFQRAWHGTPHRGIEKTGFKLNNIGTGEGAQAYGYGMYFASQREVAEHYRSVLAGRDGSPDGYAAHTVAVYAGDETKALAYLQSILPPKGETTFTGESQELVQQAIESLQDGSYKAKANQGQLYQAEIPEDSDLLDWDKPLSEQPQKVRKALSSILLTKKEKERLQELDSQEYNYGFDANGNPIDSNFDEVNAAIDEATRIRSEKFDPDYFAYGFYGDLGVKLGSPQAASEYLQSIGIPGLRYLDGNSRADGEGSHNYVIWDEALLTPEAAQIEAMYSRSAMKSVEANIRRGREALAKALDEKNTVHRAMFRNGMGWVDFVWGDEGRVKSSGKTKGAMGLAHILEARQRKDGVNEQQVTRLLDQIVRAIAEGREVRRDQFANTETVVVEHSGVEAVLTKRQGSNTWLLSGWNRKPSVASGAGSVAPTATTAKPTTAQPRGTEGAGSIAPDANEGNSSMYSQPGAASLDVYARMRANGNAARAQSAVGQPELSAQRKQLNQEIASAIAKLSRDFSVPIATVETIAQARGKYGRADIPSNIRGLALGGKDITLVLGNLNSVAEAEFVLWHELLHIGLARTVPRHSAAYGSMMGKLAERNKNLAAAAKRWREAFGNREVQDLMARGFGRVQALQRMHQISIEEALADLAGANPNVGWVTQALAEIQRFLRDMGFAELADWMEGAANAQALQVIAGTRKAVVTRGAVTTVGQFGPAFQSAPAYSQGGSASPLDVFPAEFLAELAAADELFQNPRATGITPQGALAQIDPSVQFVGDVTAIDERQESGADAKLLFRTNKGRDFFVFEKGGDVWLDVSRLDEGDGGSRIYAAIMDYAANTRKTFIGDPAGLSDVAMRRRLEAMISSAIKHGSTDHMQPHIRQNEGAQSLGIPPLKWRDGDTIGNIQRMIDVSLAALESHVPEFKRARYDFATGAFRNSQGQPLSDEVLREWVRHPRMRAAGVGRRSVKRGILLNTLARSERGARPGLLEQALRQQHQLVGEQAERIFYNRTVGDTENFGQDGKHDFLGSEATPEVISWAMTRFGDKVAPNGKPVWQNFVNWFGDSKVVDAEGRPLVVYHGTNNDFNTFVGSPIWFHTDSAQAFAGGAGSSIMPVYVRIERPIHRVGYFGMDDFSRPERFKFYDKSAGRWITPDGVIGDNGVVLAFDPNQIKSAAGNTGNFDPADNSIVREAESDYSANYEQFRRTETGKGIEKFLASEPISGQKDKRVAAARSQAARAVGDIHATGTLSGLSLSKDYAARQRASLVSKKAAVTHAGRARLANARCCFTPSFWQR